MNKNPFTTNDGWCEQASGSVVVSWTVSEVTHAKVHELHGQSKSG